MTRSLQKIQYCSPAWSGYYSAADRAQLDGFLKLCKGRGFCEKELPSITEIFDDTDNIFFAGMHRNFNRQLDVAYIDIKSAFDSVDRVALWKALRRHAGTVSGQVGQEKYGGHFHYFLMTTALYKL